MTWAVCDRVTLVGLTAGRIPWLDVSVPERSGAVVPRAVRGRVTLVGLAAGRILWRVVGVAKRFRYGAVVTCPEHVRVTLVGSSVGSSPCAAVNASSGSIFCSAPPIPVLRNAAVVTCEARGRIMLTGQAGDASRGTSAPTGDGSGPVFAEGSRPTHCGSRCRQSERGKQRSASDA